MAQKLGEKEQAPKEGKKSSKAPLVAGILVLLVIGAIAVYFLVLKKEDAPIEVTEEEKEEIYSAELKNPIFSPSYNFLIPLKGGKKLIDLDLSIAVEDRKALFFLSKRIPIIKDLVNATVRVRNPDELYRKQGVDAVKKELKEKINLLFTEDFILSSESQDPLPVKKVVFEKMLFRNTDSV